MWNFHTFDTKVRTAHSGIRLNATKWWHKESSLKGVYERVQANGMGCDILAELKKMPMKKREKYYDPLNYLILEYPSINASWEVLRGVIPPSPVPPTHTFENNVDLRRGDLVYGIQPGRCHAKYRLINGYGRFCDQYNNHYGIGTGKAFKAVKRDNLSKRKGRRWVNAYVRGTHQLNAPSNLPDQGSDREVTMDMANAYFDTLMGSRFSPDHAFDVPLNKLQKEKNDNSWGETELRWMKSIRRACKSGIHMVATHPTFVNRQAKIHFVLDFMGDLKKVALKEPLHDDGRKYVSITTSELRYVFRNWTTPNIMLRDVVKLYVNAKEVNAPWVEDWTLRDCSNKIVHSGFQYWHRYELSRRLLKGKNGGDGDQ